MKKKVTIISLALALIAILAIGSSLAWFTDEDQATNTFTIGSVKIQQDEKEHDENGELQDFTQGQMLLPVVDTENVTEDANYVEKLVSVKNTGKNDAYVRTFIAVPAALQEVLHLDVATDSADGWSKDAQTWPNVVVEEGASAVEYAVISFTYNKALEKDEATPYVLKGIYLDAAVDIKSNASGEKQFCTMNSDGTYKFYDFDITREVKVLVATQGCQTAGFEGGAADALDTAFGIAPDFTLVTP